ncbi:hypothetical protein ACFRKB_36225 [Streptomyces scopuliridis]|uniref:hypothetical protein n=1 Tax=Streptomyces scopuliridis TaxID=452529 RepID=UPI0036A142FF
MPSRSLTGRRRDDRWSRTLQTCGRQPATTEYCQPQAAAISLAAANFSASSSLISPIGRTSNSRIPPPITAK